MVVADENKLPFESRENNTRMMPFLWPAISIYLSVDILYI